jgi:hypothetical protein
MPTLSSLVVTRLMSGFQDLLRFHAESLAADETELLTSVIALADELRRGPFSNTINHAALLPYPGGEVSGAQGSGVNAITKGNFRTPARQAVPGGEPPASSAVRPGHAKTRGRSRLSCRLAQAQYPD